tara:strand:+ start:9290 stop:10324 length:1035 start_codon:yes stop_codon:yes gene_type:complete
MAYTALNLGYNQVAGIEYRGTIDSTADFSAIPNGLSVLNLQDRQVYYKDITGYISCLTNSSNALIQQYVNSSTQWNATPAAPVSLNNGDSANGFTFFTEADKDSDGTTSYDEYFIHNSRTVYVQGGAGGDVLTVTIDGVNYTEPFNTDQFITARNWVNTHYATLRALTPRITPHALGSGTDGRIRICSIFSNAAVLDAITASGTGTLAPVVGGEFNGGPGTASIGDHIIIPKDLDKPYKDLRILHTIRVNFNIATGSVQTLALSLTRMQDDSVVGSEIKVARDQDETGNQYIFETYTNSLLDPFVTGGFYFKLRNDSGANISIAALPVGILIQNIFQSPISFTQ